MEKIKITELEMDYLLFQDLLNDEKELLTDYGKGIINAYLNSNIKKQVPVILKSDYDKLKKKYYKIPRWIRYIFK